MSEEVKKCTLFLFIPGRPHHRGPVLRQGRQEGHVQDIQGGTNDITHGRFPTIEYYVFPFQKLYGPKYVWFFIGWYEDDWFRNEARLRSEGIGCTPSQVCNGFEIICEN